MPELYGRRSGRDMLFRPATDADWNEADHPRARSGQFGSGGGGGAKLAEAGAEPAQAGGTRQKAAEPGGSSPAKASSEPGIKARGEAAATEWRDAQVADSPIESIDDLIGDAAEANQASLAKIATAMADETGAEFKNPGVKERESLTRKLSRPGKFPSMITDAVRGGFMVRSPQQADTIVAAYASEMPVADEGWNETEVGYFDRKVLVKFPNGQMGELQFWHPDLLAAKEEGGAHEHYKKWMELPKTDLAGIKREVDAQRAIYQPVLDRLPEAWKAALGKSGS